MFGSFRACLLWMTSQSVRSSSQSGCLSECSIIVRNIVVSHKNTVQNWILSRWDWLNSQEFVGATEGRSFKQGWPETCGLPSRPLIWFPFKRTFFKLFWPRTGLANICRTRDQMADNFHTNSLAWGKPEFTSTIFPFIAVMPYRPL